MHRSIYLPLLLLILVLPLALVGSGWTPVLAAGSGPTHMYLPLLFRSATVWPQIALLPLVSGVSQPVHVTNAGDGSGRIFVVEQGGRIRIIRNGVLEATPFLDIAGRVGCCGERGLLSVAFPPGYAAKGHFYVNYTDKSGNTVVARYRLTTNPDVADPGSEQVVLTVSQPYANHNGGQLAFGPMTATSTSAWATADRVATRRTVPRTRGTARQAAAHRRGGRRAQPVHDPAHVIPSPKRSAIAGEIWALGLRNPWRFSFDRLTGDLYIADVGQNAYEEVDFQPARQRRAARTTAGASWKAHTAITRADCDPSGLTLPVVEYSHAEGCSITGGVVYRGHNSTGCRASTSMPTIVAAGSGDCAAPLHRGHPVCFSIRLFLSRPLGKTKRGRSMWPTLAEVRSTGSSIRS